MGTRHLIAVQLDGEYKIAQYGQWDGYPDGQGRDILKFLRRFNREKFEKKLRAASFYTEDELNKLGDEFKRKGIHDTWPQHYPWLSRDAGADVLNLVMNQPDGIKLKNSIEFSADSLMCEYGYVIDLDKDVLEVYKGFNKKKLPKRHRFAKYTKELRPEVFDDGKQYLHIRKVASYPLDSLPNLRQMKKDVDPPDNDE